MARGKAKRDLIVDVDSPAELDRICREGLPVADLDRLVAGGLFSSAEVDRLVLPRRTLAHRRANRDKLSSEESGRAIRIARVAALAEETFGARDKAAAWLRRETRALGGEAPIRLLETEPGARLVEDTLHRIAHGIAA